MGGSVLLLVTRCKLESSVVWMKSQRHERTLPVNILSNIVVPFLHTVCLSVCLSQQHRGAIPPHRPFLCLVRTPHPRLVPLPHLATTAWYATIGTTALWDQWHASPPTLEKVGTKCTLVHPTFATGCHFYRAMLCIRDTSHGPVSVRPSVRHKSLFY